MLPQATDISTVNNFIAEYNKIEGNSASPLDTEKSYHDFFETLRNSIDIQHWYRPKELKNFLFNSCNTNPFVPEETKKLNDHYNETIQNGSKYGNGPTHFINAWLDKFGKQSVQTTSISPEEFIASTLGNPVLEKFAKNNLHNHSYFFTKYAEWFISIKEIAENNYQKIVDIGSAFDGFAKTCISKTDITSITLVDLIYEDGINQVSDKEYTYGTSAENLKEIETGSIDFVCIHNAIEHFENDSDSGCIKEIHRILRPGGKALITPFFYATRYSISINPIPCFFTSDIQTQKHYKQLCSREHNENMALIRFTNNMISPFARIYDFESTVNRILNHFSSDKFCFKKIRFENSHTLEQKQLPAYDLILEKDIFEKVNFASLELIK